MSDIFCLSTCFMNSDLFFLSSLVFVYTAEGLGIYFDYQQIKREYCDKYSLFICFIYIINYFTISFSLMLWNVM